MVGRASVRTDMGAGSSRIQAKGMEQEIAHEAASSYLAVIEPVKGKGAGHRKVSEKSAADPHQSATKGRLVKTTVPNLRASTRITNFLRNTALWCSFRKYVKYHPYTDSFIRFTKWMFDTVGYYSTFPLRDVKICRSEIHGIPAVWVASEKSLHNPNVIFAIPGGADLIGSPDSHLNLLVALAKESETRVLAIDYSKGPSLPYPAGLNDTLRAYDHLTKELGYKAENIIMFGDSAAGKVVLQALGKLKETDPERMPLAAVLVSPWTDLTMSGESISRNAAVDPIIHPSRMHQVASSHRGQLDASDPRISTLFADLSGMPDLGVYVGTLEVLHSDAERLVERAVAAGVNVDYTEYEGMHHAFPVYGYWSRVSTSAIRDMARFITNQFKLEM